MNSPTKLSMTTASLLNEGTPRSVQALREMLVLAQVELLCAEWV